MLPGRAAVRRGSSYAKRSGYSFLMCHFCSEISENRFLFFRIYRNRLFHHKQLIQKSVWIVRFENPFIPLARINQNFCLFHWSPHVCFDLADRSHRRSLNTGNFDVIRDGSAAFSWPDSSWFHSVDLANWFGKEAQCEARRRRFIHTWDAIISISQRLNRS